MPFDFGQVEPNTVGQVSKWDIPISDWMGFRFGEGLFGRVGPRLTDFTTGIFDNSPMLTPETANSWYGVPGYLSFDSPVRMERARAMQERKNQELEMMSYAASASHSWASMKAAAGFGAMAAGSLMHPVDALINLIPFVGSEAKAASVLKLGGNALEQALARGVVTTEALAKAPIMRFFPNFSRNLIDAYIGNAIFEVPNYILNVRDQAVYGLPDSAYNVLLGGAIGGAFGYGLSRSMHLAHAAYAKLTPETRDLLFHDAMGAALRGENPHPERYAALDENALREQVKFDELAAREAALRETAGPEEARLRAELEVLNRGDVGPTDLLITARKAVEESPGAPRSVILNRLIERFTAGERTPEIFQALASQFDLRYNPVATTVQEAYKQAAFFEPLQGAAAEGRNRLRRAEAELRSTMAAIEATARQIEARPTVAESETLRRNLGRLERMRNRLADEIQQAQTRLKEATGGGPLSPEELQMHAASLEAQGQLGAPLDVRAQSIQSRLDALRQERIKNFVETARADWEKSAQGRLSEARAAELHRQQQEGKLLTDEQIKTLADTKTEKAAATIENATKEVEASLKAMNIEVPKTQTEAVHVPRDKAIQKAVSCLLV